MTSILVFLLSLTAVFIVVLGAGVFWAIHSGQFEDLEGPAQRIIMDDDDPLIPYNALKQTENQTKIATSDSSSEAVPMTKDK